MTGRWNCVECAYPNPQRVYRCKLCSSRAGVGAISGMERPLWTLGLECRTFNILTRDYARAGGVTPRTAREQMTVADLVGYTATRLLLLRGFGWACLDEVRSTLSELGLTLAGDVAELPAAA